MLGGSSQLVSGLQPQLQVDLPYLSHVYPGL